MIRVKRFINNVKRSFAYARFGFENRDFDHAYLIKLIEFKLKRMETAIIHHGCHIAEKDEAQSLRLAIKLAGRLHSHHYEHPGEKGLIRDSKWLFGIMGKYYRLWWD